MRERHVQFCEAIYTFTRTAVRTNIEIDDALLAEAMAATGLRTKRKVVEAGLRLLARQKRQADARKLFGRVRWEGDLHRERLDEPDDPDRGR
jgi:Arc/MetJ family transcription regulator